MKDLIVDKIFSQLFNDITKGIIPQGERLKEHVLSEKLGSSRGPLREALRRLEAKRLVTIIPNVGAQVIRLKPEDVIELYTIRESLEGMASRLAAAAMENAEIERLKKLVNSQSQMGDGEKDFLFSNKENLDFHSRIIKGSRNNRLNHILCEDLYCQIMLCRNQYSTPFRKSISVRRHLDILEAIENRDPELAEILMRRHIAEAKQYIVDNNYKN